MNVLCIYSKVLVKLLLISEYFINKILISLIMNYLMKKMNILNT